MCHQASASHKILTREAIDCVTVEYSLLLHAFKSVTAEGAMPVFGVALNFHFLVPNDKCQQEVPIFLFLCTHVIVLMLPFFFQELASSCWSSITLQPKLDSKIKFSDVYAIEMLDKGPICGPWRTAIQGKKNIEVMAFLLVIIHLIFSKIHQTILPTNIR